MLDLATRERDLQDYLHAHHPALPLDARDVLILRACWQHRRRPGYRLPGALATATEIPRDDVVARLTRLHAEDWLRDAVGYSVTARGRALGTLLWVCACGCTDERACPRGCYWIREDQCSRCTNPDQEDYATRLRMDAPIRFPETAVSR